MERVAPSARLEAQITELLSEGITGGEKLAEVGRLGARLVLQRAVEDEVTAFLGRARYQRTPRGGRVAQRHAAEGGPDRRRRDQRRDAAGSRRRRALHQPGVPR